MENNSSSKLTHMVLQYQKTGAKRDELIRLIAGIVYAYPRKHLRWDEDDAGDFFCLYYPKIKKLIDRFQFSGKPFEAYLTTSIRWQIKTYATQSASRNVRDKLMNHEYHNWYERRARHPDQVFEGETAYVPAVARILKINQDGVIGTKSHSLRLMYLILRNSLQIDDEILKRSAKLTGMDEDLLLGHVTELRQRLSRKLQAYGKLASRRNLMHVRIQHLHGLLGRETDDERCEQILHELAKERTKFTKITQEISTISLVPTHKDIAEVLNVPKGSVDSGLYYLKNAFGKIGMN